MLSQLRIYIFEIVLVGTEPPVWRIVEINKNMKLHDLHRVIQLAMGWENRHLYSFIRKTNNHVIEYTLPEYDDEQSEFAENDPRQYKLKDIFTAAGDEIMYLYDYGDNWEHRVIFKGSKYATSYNGYPSCTAGARACPPEDVGGIPGYNEMLRSIAEKNKKELAYYREWLGGQFDPDGFAADKFFFFSKMLRRFK